MATLIVLIAIVAVPIAEIMVLIEVGGVIGTIPTVALVVLTAVVGTALIRHQGLSALAALRRDIDEGRPPIGAAVDGAFLLVAGALMLTPGFITDAIGFAFLVPPFRRSLARWIARRLLESGRVHVHGAGRAEESPRSKPVIDGEFVEVEPSRAPDEGSPWRKTGQQESPKETDGRSQA